MWASAYLRPSASPSQYLSEPPPTGNTSRTPRKRNPQIVMYPIMNLRRYRQDIHWYLRALEETVIRTLAKLGLRGERVEGLTGVWVDGRKVAVRKTARKMSGKCRPFWASRVRSYRNTLPPRTLTFPFRDAGPRMDRGRGRPRGVLYFWPSCSAPLATRPVRGGDTEVPASR